MQKFKEIGDSKYIYQNELDKACFHTDMAYGDFKDLTRRTASGKILREKAYNIARNLKFDAYQCGLASMVYKFSDKKSFGSVVKNKNMSDQCPSQLAGVGKVSDHTRQLAGELHKPIIRKFEKVKYNQLL